MADDVGPQQQPFELGQRINVLGNSFDFIVRKVQFSLKAHGIVRMLGVEMLRNKIRLLIDTRVDIPGMGNSHIVVNLTTR